MTTRGERNNNPGNIELGSNWMGLCPEQTDGRFCQFTDVKYGIRALAKIMLMYRLEGFDCVRTIIERWAPSTENNTNAYVADVAKRMGVDPNIDLDTSDYSQLYPLVVAIIGHENGEMIYSKDQIDEGLALAGVVP